MPCLKHTLSELLLQLRQAGRGVWWQLWWISEFAALYRGMEHDMTSSAPSGGPAEEAAEGRLNSRCIEVCMRPLPAPKWRNSESEELLELLELFGVGAWEKLSQQFSLGPTQKVPTVPTVPHYLGTLSVRLMHFYPCYAA